MATLVLTVAGGLLGGPFGAALGSSIGNVVDREVLFRPKGREGPRLRELKLQTSSYGTQIPRLFGAMRVAGSVIWATDLIEHRSTSGGGKNRVATTSYSYTASFAVALSSRPILRVGRIWADGKLLRGAAGDWKMRTGFRLYLGGEAQAPDPLIAAAEGSVRAPAHRGIAYAVFEHLELGEFGNRIPSLSFEVFADNREVKVGQITSEISAGAITPVGATAGLVGFSAYGASIRAVVETLAGATGGWFRTDENDLKLLSGAGEARLVQDAAIAARGKTQGRVRRSVAAIDQAPRRLTLAHYDPARDYQSGVQSAARPGAGTREARLELPAAIGGSGAKAIAEAALARFDVERARRTITVAWGGLTIRPGERVQIASESGMWRVDRWTLEGMVLSLDCVAVSPAPIPVSASSGRIVPQPDAVIGTTILRAFPLPQLDQGAAGAPQIGIAAGGTGAGWRGAALLLSNDQGASWSAIGRTALPAIVGSVTGTVGVAPPWIEDRLNEIEIELGSANMSLEDADASALDRGANLARVGEELLQFGRAEQISATRWRLRQLWRGRRGTEHAIGTQANGAAFTLLDAETLLVLPRPTTDLGAELRLLAEGVGDITGPVECRVNLIGADFAPPAPVHVRALRRPDGGVDLRWIRRSRRGWQWLDGTDAPLGEERERYLVRLNPEEASEQTFTTDSSYLSLSPDQSSPGSTLQIHQIGDHGLSHPATHTLQ